MVCQSTELAALRAEVAQLQRQLSEGAASLAIVPSLEKHSSEDADHKDSRQQEDCCGQQTGTDVHAFDLMMAVTWKQV